MGAEVSFYVQGMEQKPQEIVNLLMEYYQRYEHGQELVQFQRYEKTLVQ